MPQIVDIQTMPATTKGGNPCYVAYSDTARVCVVAATREEAIELCAKRAMRKLGAKQAGIVDCAEAVKPAVPRCPEPSMN